jgi:2'-5' RNA ligase
MILKMSDQMKRIFIALKVETGERLLNMISSLKTGLASDSIRWTSIDNIHITIVFLGDTENNVIQEIRLMLNEKCKGSGKFNLYLKGCGIFRSTNDPRIIWTGVETSDNLMSLNESVLNGLKQLGINKEDRPYNPHLTLGRIKHINDIKVLKSLVDQYRNSDIQVVPVNEVTLYESILQHSGPIYKPLEKFSL